MWVLISLWSSFSKMKSAMSPLGCFQHGATVLDTVQSSSSIPELVREIVKKYSVSVLVLASQGSGLSLNSFMLSLE